jgi:hypothetical protein
MERFSGAFLAGDPGALYADGRLEETSHMMDDVMMDTEGPTEAGGKRVWVLRSIWFWSE